MTTISFMTIVVFLVKELSDANNRRTIVVTLHIPTFFNYPENETMIHKVWKLQESKRLATLKVSGSLIFGMDLFNVIDLTDKSKLIMVSKECSAPTSGGYKIKSDLMGSIQITHLELLTCLRIPLF